MYYLHFKTMILHATTIWHVGWFKERDRASKFLKNVQMENKMQEVEHPYMKHYRPTVIVLVHVYPVLPQHKMDTHFIKLTLINNIDSQYIFFPCNFC